MKKESNMKNLKRSLENNYTSICCDALPDEETLDEHYVGRCSNCKEMSEFILNLEETN